MRRMGRGRQIAAGDFVLALRAGFDARQFVRNAEIDRLVIAEFEMQERMMFDGAPMAAEQRA
jgi:hypothetical protein